MTLAEAKSVLYRHAGGENVGDHTFTAAAAYMNSFYAANPHLLHKPKLTRDAKSGMIIRDLPNTRIGIDPPPDQVAGAVGTRATALSAGPRRILRLTGPASSYGLTTSADGEVWLIQHSSVSGTGEGMREGETKLGNREPLSADALTQARYRAMDEAKVKLSAINARNKAFWAQGAH